MIGDIDLILASPECTSHTCAKGAAARSEESRLTAFEVIRYAAKFRPKWIAIENVVHIRSWHAYPELLNSLRRLGYEINETKLNARDFGVPQSRTRLFILCSRLGLPRFTGVSATEIRPASSIIANNGNYRFTPLFSPGRAKATIARAQRAISQLKGDEPFLIVYYGTDQSGGWQPIDRPLRTVTTLDRFAYVKSSFDGLMMRMLQPEELKLAMGFPTTYKLTGGTRRDKVRLMGNAVCPPVMESVVRSLLSQDPEEEIAQNNPK
jgi:DNA (cytosine-5)-methyltransferase 1